jgi:hypothetical protein
MDPSGAPVRRGRMPAVTGRGRKQEDFMADSDSRQVAQFLETHRAAIQQIILRAYQEAGGHYQAMTPPQQAHQAEIDSDEFIIDLLRGTPDRETIQQTVAAAATTTIVSDIVNMAAALDRFFAAYVAERLPGDPRLAQELTRRSNYITARFRLSISASQITNLVRGEDQPAPQVRRRLP